MLNRWLAVLVGGAVAVAGFVTVGGDDEDYQLTFLMTSADFAFEGAPVTIAGNEVGEVTAIGVQDGLARVTVSIDDSAAPLHAGTRARIRWASILGRRSVDLLPGAEKNPTLPSGKTIESDLQRVELDDVLAALDEPTRRRLQGLTDELRTTLAGNEQALNRTIAGAGPFVKTIGEVVHSVGQDGQAIRSLVANLQAVTQVLAGRDQELSRTVSNLSALLREVAVQQDQVSAALAEAPATVEAATRLFSGIPSAVDAAMPLLEELEPATRQLPAAARQLNPVLRDLRPTVAELRPTLASLQSLLHFTPGLLDVAHSTVPDVDAALQAAAPAIAFLRPYTPEIIGFVTNWTSLFSPKNSSGHYGRALITGSATAANFNPGLLPPGLEQDPTPAPGSLVGQPWTDANGDAVR